MATTLAPSQLELLEQRLAAAKEADYDAPVSDNDEAPEYDPYAAASGRLAGDYEEMIDEELARIQKRAAARGEDLDALTDDEDLGELDANGEPLEGIFSKIKNAFAGKKKRAQHSLEDAQKKAAETQVKADHAARILKRKEDDRAKAAMTQDDTKSSILPPMRALQATDALGLPALRKMATPVAGTGLSITALAAASPATTTALERGNQSEDTVTLRVGQDVFTQRVPVSLYTFKDKAQTLAVYTLTPFAIKKDDLRKTTADKTVKARAFELNVDDRVKAHGKLHWRFTVPLDAGTTFAPATTALPLPTLGFDASGQLATLSVLYANPALPVATSVATSEMLAAEHNLANVLKALDMQQVSPLSAAEALGKNATESHLHYEAVVGLSAALAGVRREVEKDKPALKELAASQRAYLAKNSTKSPLPAEQASAVVAAIEDYAQTLRCACGGDDIAQMARGQILAEHLLARSNALHHVGLLAQLSDALQLVQGRLSGASMAKDTETRMNRFWASTGNYHDVVHEWFVK
jgi:hypothetical protein